MSPTCPVTAGKAHRRSAFIAIGVFCFPSLGASVASPAPNTDWQSRVSPALVRTYEAATNVPQKSSVAEPRPSPASTVRVDASGRVQVDVHVDCTADPPVAALKAAGLKVTAAVRLAPTCVVEGWVNPASLPKIAGVPAVERVTTPSYSLHKPRRTPATPAAPSIQGAPVPGSSTIMSLPAGILQAAVNPAIDATAIAISHAGTYIGQTGVSGTGVTVGVMSDDATNLSVIQSRAELPVVNVIPSSASPSPTDEGTMMLEEVYAMAPGASLAFCGPQTTVEYLSCLQGLAAAGATIVVDDIAYYDEDLMSSTGQFAQSVQSFLTGNPSVLLFTVTENFNGSYWEGNYTPVAIASLGAGYNSLTCPVTNQTDYYAGAAFQLTVTVGGTYPMWLQWADSWGQNTSNFEVYAVDVTTKQGSCLSAAGSANTYFGGDPVLVAGDTYDVLIATPDASLAGKFVKFFVGGDGATALNPSTPGSIVSPQAFVPGVALVGAVDGSDGIGDTIEPYSGRGPITLQFPTASSIQAPSFVSEDAVYVDTAGTLFTPWSDGNFHGTSAAAPNAAAVAALISSAFPTLTPKELMGYLQTGAVLLGATSPDSIYGYGRVDAMGALAVIPAPSITSLSGVSLVCCAASPASATLRRWSRGSWHLWVDGSASPILERAVGPPSH